MDILFYSPLESLYPPLECLYQYFSQVKDWMSKNFPKLNADKTEVIIFWKKEHKLKTAALLGTKGFKVADSVRSLGVTIESDLSFRSHMKAITKYAFYHLKNISKVKSKNHQET